MSRYSPDTLNHWTYNKVLLHFRRFGEKSATRDLLKKAQRRNENVPYYLLGRKSDASWEMDYVDAGDESEAFEYQRIYHGAWEITPGALGWLGRYTDLV
jgi:hypothetical protein